MKTLQKENIALAERIKTSEKEVFELKTMLHRKTDMIEKLEKQIENIPTLKRMVHEMERMLEGGRPVSAANENPLKPSQRTNKNNIHNVID